MFFAPMFMEKMWGEEGDDGGGEVEESGGVFDDVGRTFGLGADYMCPECGADMDGSSHICSSCGYETTGRFE